MLLEDLLYRVPRRSKSEVEGSLYLQILMQAFAVLCVKPSMPCFCTVWGSFWQVHIPEPRLTLSARKRGRWLRIQFLNLAQAAL